MLFSKKRPVPDYMEGVEIVRSARRKTISLQVKAGKVRVLCPSWVKMSQLQGFIAEKQHWINEKLDLQRIALTQPKVFWLEHGQQILIQGQLCKIVHVTGEVVSKDAGSANNRPSVHLRSKTAAVSIRADLTQHRIYFYVHDEILGASDLEKQALFVVAFNDYCQQQAQVRFTQRLEHWQEIMGLYASELKVRYYKSRWGSCDNRSRVTLNNRLIMVPENVLDYVIIHELCHITHQNHSPRFWSLVERFCPQFQHSRLWLKQYQSNLLHN